MAKLNEDSWERCEFHEVNESDVGEVSNLVLSHWHVTTEEENIKEGDTFEWALGDNDLNTKQLGQAFGKLKKPSNILGEKTAFLISPGK